jgi:hypothetical protein
MKKTTLLAFAALILLALALSACAGSSTAPETQADAPAPEQPVVDVASPDNQLYAEDFDDGDSCFAEEQLENASLQLDNGELVIDVQSADQLLWSTCYDVELSNFNIGVDILDDSRSSGFRFFGVLLREQPVDNESNQWYEINFGMGEGFSPAYCAGVGSESTFESFTESLYDDSCWVDLPVEIEAGEWNRFEIRADGPVLTILVNNTFVAALNDPRIDQGFFGITAGTFDGESAHIKFDNIQITAIDN